MTPAKTRAAALQAAATWLAGEQPYPSGRDWLLECAEVFVAWIEGDETEETER